MITNQFMTSRIVTSILEEYKAASTDRAKAIIEERLWAQASASVRAEYKKADFLKEMLGAPSGYAFQLRAALLRAPDVVWERVETGGMPLKTALRLWREANKSEDTLAAILETYDKQPMYKLPNGRFFRKAGNGGRALRQGQTIDNAKSGWTRIKAELGAILREHAGQVADTTQFNDIVTEFEHELQGLCRLFVGQIGALRRGAQPEVNRRQIIDACHTLHIDPPSPGGHVDQAKAAHSKRKLSRLYHPDLRGSESTRGMFERVVAAYNTVVNYENRLRKLCKTTIKEENEKEKDEKKKDEKK